MLPRLQAFYRKRAGMAIASTHANCAEYVALPKGVAPPGPLARLFAGSKSGRYVTDVEANGRLYLLLTCYLYVLSAVQRAPAIASDGLRGCMADAGSLEP
jgi:hypothetical protein